MRLFYVSPEIVKAIGIPNKRFPDRPPILRILTPPRDGKIAFPTDFIPEIDKEYLVEIITEKQNYARVKQHHHFFIPTNVKYIENGTLYQKYQCACGESIYRSIKKFSDIKEEIKAYLELKKDDPNPPIFGFIQMEHKHFFGNPIYVNRPDYGFIVEIPEPLIFDINIGGIYYLSKNLDYAILRFDDVNGWALYTNLDPDYALRILGALQREYDLTFGKFYSISSFSNRFLREEKIKWNSLIPKYRFFNMALKTKKIYHYKIKFHYQSKPWLRGEWPHVYTSQTEKKFEFDVYLPAKIEKIKVYTKHEKKVDEGEHVTYFEPLVSSFDVGAKLEIDPVLVEEIPFDPLNPIFDEKIYRIGLKNIMIYKNGYYFDIQLDIPKIELDEEYTLPDPEIMDLLLNQYLGGVLK